MIIGLASLLVGFAMLLLAVVMLAQHPWLVPGTLLVLWSLARWCRGALDRL